MGAPELRLLGLNFRSADVSLRSRVALAGPRLQQFLLSLREHGVAEAIVLSTCNRTEIYTVGGEAPPLIELLSNAAGVSAAELWTHAYQKGGGCAACHLFRVASGLDSAVLGETEIVAQVKAAWRDGGFPGPTLDLLFQRALEASKRVRSETALCRNVTSVGSLAVREAQRHVGPLTDRAVLLLGAGQIAERVAKELSALGVRRVTVLNRTVERGTEVADRFGFASGPLEDLPAALADVDVVFATATAPGPLITVDNAPIGRDPLFVDLGIPRNIDVPGRRTLDIDSLAAQCAENADARNAAIPDALGILDAELERLLVSLTERQAASTIQGLVEHGEVVRQRTLAWALERLPDLDEKERRVVEDLARRMVLGMLMPPIEELKKGAFTSHERATVERAFRLAPKEQDG
ncbi:MAG: glutamyl-tRNA reductase [Fimbriimonas sp.]